MRTGAVSKLLIFHRRNDLISLIHASTHGVPELYEETSVIRLVFHGDRMVGVVLETCVEKWMIIRKALKLM